MPTFHHTFGFFNNKPCYFYVVGCRFIKCGCYYFCIYGACHIGYLFWAFVYEKHHKICVGMILGYGIGNVFKQHCLTRLGLCHYKSALTFSDRGEQVNDTCGNIVVISGAKSKLLVREQRSKMFERNSISYNFGINAVDFCCFLKCEEFFAFVWNSNRTFNNISCFQTVCFYLLS